MSSQGPGAVAIVVYTAMRVGLFLAVWLLLQLLTPLRGLWAAVLAIVVSGLISLLVLNRQRSAMGGVVGGFFRGINERIDAASRAEDFDDEPEAQGQRVGDDEAPGGSEGWDQISTRGTSHDDPPGLDGPGDAGEGEQRPQ